MRKRSILKSFLLIFAGMIIGIILFISLITFIFINFSKNPVIVKNNSWLILNFTGQISEKPLSNISSLLGGQKRIELIKYINSIENAATDNKISGIIINGDISFYTSVHVKEIRNSLEKFKKSGKKINAWFSTANNNNYSLCLSADNIYMPDTDSASLTIKGYSLSIPYCKKGLDKLGLEFNVIHIGNYKGAGENYARDNMSEELRESYLSLLNSFYNQNINEISNARNIKINKLQKMMKSGKTIFMTPNAAEKAGFIDGKKNYQELIKSLSYNSSLNTISIYDYALSLRKKEKIDKIAILYAEGLITNYYSGNNKLSGDIIGAKTFIQDINKIKEDKNVKAVIIRVNSSGGSALASELILQALQDLKKKKPVYVSLGPIAASGGYYISCGADRIFTSPYTVTGSIGVVSLLLNHKNLNEKLGINFETIKKHKYDDFLSPTRKPSDDEINILRKSMKNIYNEFTGHVIKERKIEKKEISKIAEGRVWTGVQAVKNNLADEIGGLLDALNYAVTKNNIENYSIDSYPAAPNIFDKLSNINQINFYLDIYNDENIKRLLNLYLFYSKNGTSPCLVLPFYQLP
ncbi:MAG: signal peptide peptidase SppA [Spirochaetes bacterium]|nr:signal peptide peptidase SppA [Spirochaetota bacterium]